MMATRTRRAKRARVEVEMEDGETSKYFKKEEMTPVSVTKPYKPGPPENDKVDVEMVKKMDSDTYFKWLNGRTKDEVTYAPLVDRPEFPRNFVSIYSKVRLMRSKIATPVDSVGCGMIPLTVGKEFGVTQEQSKPRNYRFQLLIALMLSSQTKDEVNAKAMFNLTEYCRDELNESEGVTLEAMFKIDQETLAELIYPVS